jgi:hypothetical protein
VRTDILVAGPLILLAAWGVAGQLGFDPFDGGDEPIRPIALGERLELDLVLSDLTTRPRDPTKLYGSTATVLYTWSVPCPCIDVLEPRLRALHARYGLSNPGVRWIALAGEPEDTRAKVKDKAERLGVFYEVLLDPEQEVCRRLGLIHAAQVAVLDGEGRLVYRGAVDAEYDEGQAEHLEEALAAVVAGRPVPVPERAYTYGCEFNVPESCLEWERPQSALPQEDP